MVRAAVLLSFYLISLIVLLFASAGRVDWPMGWAALGVHVAISIATLILIDPELVKERASIKEGVKSQDAVLASISFVILFPVAVFVAGLDAGRFEWSPSFPIALQLAALVVFALGDIFGCWAMVANKFFSSFVRIQEDRDHKVIRDGPYQYVRHPGYAGIVVSAIALPIALGSLWALIPVFIGVCGFIIRTAMEDRTLMDELNGYRGYADDVRYRLIPGVW